MTSMSANVSPQVAAVIALFGEAAAAAVAETSTAHAAGHAAIRADTATGTPHHRPADCGGRRAAGPAHLPAHGGDEQLVSAVGGAH